MNTVNIPRLLQQSTFLLLLIGFSLLTACGGSDKKSNASSSSSSHIFVPTPVTPPGAGIWPDIKVSANGTKTLKFEWTDANLPSGTTFYKLLKKADNTSTYVQVGDNFTGLSIIDPISVHLTDWVNSRYKVQACSDTGCVDSTEIITDSAMLSAISYVKASNTQADDWFGWSVTISGDGNTLAVGAPAESSNAMGANGDQANDLSDNSGAVYVFIKNEAGNWQQEAYLKASNTEQPNLGTDLTQLENDRFGYQVALSTDGNTLAVSAILEDSPSSGISTEINCYQNDIEYTTSNVKKHLPTDTGAVYIFKRTETVWAQSNYVKAMYFAPGTQFGLSLAISGDGKTLAVGTPFDKANIAGILVQSSSSSSTECFNYNASDFSSSSSTSSDSSTISSNAFISVSNSSLAVPGGTNSGAVHVYKESDIGEWTQEAFVKAPDAKPDSNFGTSIALSLDGTTLVIGADGDLVNGEGLVQNIQKDGNTYYFRSGAAYVYSRTNQITTFQQKLKPSPNLINLRFGASVAVSGDGNTISVGAPGSLDPSIGINPTINETELNISYIDGVNSGKKVKPDYGSAYIFVRSDTTWVQQSYIKASNSISDYEFGSCTALSYDGSVLAIGSMRESSAAKGINGDEKDSSATLSGAAYVFALTGNSWLQRSYVKAPNSDANDRFGRALGLDASGETLMIGAHRESSNAQGVNGDRANNAATASGAIYLY
jgi:trimeric autotransporter adhesin